VPPTVLIDQYLEKDLYLRKVIREQARQLCANEDEMATYDDEEKALNKRIADLEAQLAKLKPAPAPSTSG
jgi:cell division protein FtsB